MTKEEIIKLHDFYDIERDKTGKPTIKLDRLKIMRKLKGLGYYRYDTPDGASQYVYIRDNKISITRESFMIDAFEDYVKNLPTREDKVITDDTERESHITPEILLSKLYQNLQSYFGSSTFERLRPDKKIEILHDSPEKKYLFFNNVAVYVDKDGVHNLQYSEMNGYIWEGAILEHDFFYTEQKGDFEKFVENITGKDEDRKTSLMSMLGYLMHDSYECNHKAVLLTDANNEAIGKSSGGTGKGILGKALSCMLNKTNADCRYVAINGKDIDLKSNTRYALADLSTQLIHIEDLYKGADFEQLFCDITDGATIRKPYQIRPIVKLIKMMISVNHTIRLTDEDSKLRRVYIFELQPYYGASYTPEDEFGKRFFESRWSPDDWICFYSFMCRCVQTYLSAGVIAPNNSDYAFRELLENTNEDFIYWFDSKINHNIKEEQEYTKQTLYQTFVEKYPSFNNIRFTNKTFTSWCRLYFKTKNIPYVEIRSTKDLFVIYPTQMSIAKAQAQKNKLKS